MRSFAIYRLPFAKECTMLVQHSAPSELSSLTELDDKEGFVIAPFSPSNDSPILLLQPDEVTTMLVKDVKPLSTEVLEANENEIERNQYHRDFSAFHKELTNNRFAKIVLARCVQEQILRDLNPEEVFWQACKKYPRQFVALFSTPQSGIWIMATPEILLDGDGIGWRTMALAGTMPYNENGITWSSKNKAEQKYVSLYIKSCLERCADEIKEEGPYTTQAANLVHLRTDFTFKLRPNAAVGQLLDDLHPTPAVCGMPKNEARAFILANESSKRLYYSGFAGPLNLHGNTHIYVSLRCMQMQTGICNLYAGGGILKESTEESEWKETEAKLSTMRQLLR
ncbi:isochorismate synthase [Prevotella aurantiaca]|mgnify:FL=1|jgi:isochorismate synthase|uniref:isochorismate synthase n=1 Tax=Prevotella aurantiaca TaxID=596085 RepID=UPI0023F1D91E|nr:isochorismate synthase [Prevotella aurantiaca]